MTLTSVTSFLDRAGLTWFAPVLRLCAGQEPGLQLRALALLIGIPLGSAALFLLLWHWAAAGSKPASARFQVPRRCGPRSKD